MMRYEKDRPAPAEACRIGDGRVLASDKYTVVHRPYPLNAGTMAVDVDRRGKY